MAWTGRRRVFAAAALAGALAGALYWWWRPTTPAVVAYLPDGETLAYIDLVPLRQAGLFSGALATPLASDYAGFVRESGFDFESDLDALGLALTGPPDAPTASTALLMGRFSKSFEPYLAAHAEGRVQLGKRQGYEFPGWSHPERTVTVVLLSPHLLALSNGPPSTLEAVAHSYDRWGRPPRPAAWPPAARGTLTAAALEMDTARLAAENALGAWAWALRDTREVHADIAADASGVDLAVDATCSSEAAAQHLRDWSAQQISNLGQALPAAAAEHAAAPPAWAAELRRVVAAQSGSEARLSLHLSYPELRAWFASQP